MFCVYVYSIRLNVYKEIKYIWGARQSLQLSLQCSAMCCVHCIAECDTLNLQFTVMNYISFYFSFLNIAKFKLNLDVKTFNILWRQWCHKSKSVTCEADHGIHWVQNYYCQGLFVAVWVWTVKGPVLTNYCLFRGANRNFSWVMIVHEDFLWSLGSH